MFSINFVQIVLGKASFKVDKELLITLIYSRLCVMYQKAAKDGFSRNVGENKNISIERRLWSEIKDDGVLLTLEDVNVTQKGHVKEKDVRTHKNFAFLSIADVSFIKREGCRAFI